MNARYEMLLGLYPAEQLEQMHRIADAMLADPEILDNRKTEEIADEKGK